MKNTNRIIAGILAVLLSAGATGMTAAAKDDKAQNTVNAASASKDTESSDESSSKGKPYKDETVYIKSDCQGNTNQIIVSDWLKNAGAKSTLKDKSNLKDIENVKGDEKFTQSGEDIDWTTAGKDIYYKGTSDAELPVDVSVIYRLDGKEVQPKDILGKSGKVSITYKYKNNKKVTTTVDGKKKEVYLPVACIGGTLLDSEKFTNVKVTNGKVISNGSKLIVMGVALPGLAESLGIDD
ncbi:MAG: hypothetical protein ACI4RN_00475, partial [Oscillospiraceae bacterium]